MEKIMYWLEQAEEQIRNLFIERAAKALASILDKEEHLSGLLGGK